MRGHGSQTARGPGTARGRIIIHRSRDYRSPRYDADDPDRSGKRECLHQYQMPALQQGVQDEIIVISDQIGESEGTENHFSVAETKCYWRKPTTQFPASLTPARERSLRRRSSWKSRRKDSWGPSILGIFSQEVVTKTDNPFRAVDFQCIQISHFVVVQSIGLEVLLVHPLCFACAFSL